MNVQQFLSAVLDADPWVLLNCPNCTGPSDLAASANNSLALVALHELVREFPVESDAAQRAALQS